MGLCLRRKPPPTDGFSTIPSNYPEMFPRPSKHAAKNCSRNVPQMFPNLSKSSPNHSETLIWNKQLIISQGTAGNYFGTPYDTFARTAFCRRTFNVVLQLKTPRDKKSFRSEKRPAHYLARCVGLFPFRGSPQNRFSANLFLANLL